MIRTTFIFKFCYHTQYITHSLFVFHRCSLDLKCLGKNSVFESLSNFMLQYTKCACKHYVHSSVQCTDSVYRFLSNCIHQQYVFGPFLKLFFSFFCQTWIVSLPFDATSSHACFLCRATNRLYSLQTIHCCLKKRRDVLLNFPACWTCMVFSFLFFLFFSLCLMMCSSCRMNPKSMAFITSFYGLLTFLGQQQKSDKTPPPPNPPHTRVHFSCVEVHHHQLSSGLQ